MKKNNFYQSIAVVLLAICFLTSCNKDKEDVKPTSKQDFESAKSTLDIVSEVEDLNNTALSFALQSGSMGGRKAAIKETECGTMSYQYTNEYTFSTVTVDYGTGTTCEGVVRKGKVIFTLTQTASGNGLTMEAKFVGYEVDGKKLSGDYTLQVLPVENASENELSFNYVYTFNNAVLTYADGSKVSWNSNYELSLRLTADENNTDLPFTMHIEMKGGLSGKDKNGKTFSAEITSPLVIDGKCPYGITAGKYVLKAEGHSEALLDYGNGECDNTAILTINGKAETINIEE
jgi:hypothetical protein